MNFNEFRKLSFKEKMGWIIQYYGLKIIIGLVLIFVIFSLLHSIFAPKKIEDVCILIYSDEYMRDQAADLEKEISTAIGGSVSLEIYNVSDAYGDSAFAAKVMSNQLDLILAPKAEMEAMVESGYLHEYVKLQSDDLYIGTPEKARQGPMLDKARGYFEERE